MEDWRAAKLKVREALIEAWARKEIEDSTEPGDKGHLSELYQGLSRKTYETLIEIDRELTRELSVLGSQEEVDAMLSQWRITNRMILKERVDIDFEDDTRKRLLEGVLDMARENCKTFLRRIRVPRRISFRNFGW